MIHRLFSSLPLFKELRFEPGLNILLTEKSAEATDKQTRNRAGKSSMVQLVHFLLGGSAKPDSLPRHKALEQYFFGLELDLAGSAVTVQRRGSNKSKLVVEGEWAKWPVAPSTKGTTTTINNEDWKVVLGELLFGIKASGDAWTPSFRSMMSYFARVERQGGFLHPMRHYRQQAPADQQVSISYLLGLDWTIPHAWQQVRMREKGLEQLKKSMKDGSLGQVVDKASSLKSELVVKRSRAKALEERIAKFKVVEEYHHLEREASKLTRECSILTDENTLDRRYMEEIEKTSIEEVPPAPADMEALYREVGVILPELVRQRYDDAKRFHEAVIANRRSYLQSEIAAATRRVADRSRELEKLDRRRAEVMAILKSSGALDHFSKLQSELARLEADIESLQQRFEAAMALESGEVALKEERARLERRLREDYKEQDDRVEAAILTFQDISSRLYEELHEGRFTITPTQNGPEFEVTIQGAKSKGVNNMQIFCFDMMLMLLSLERGRSPGFLIHDSHLFDGVDERQKANAIILGDKLSREYGFQYIVTMNSDDLPKELYQSMDLDAHLLDVKLSDKTDTGGLFGFRFG